MESSESIGLTKNKKLILKVVIAFLAIAVVGQISAIFIPAMVGKTPSVTSMIGTPLWVGLLFMVVWMLKEKSKVQGFFIGVLVGFVLHFFAGSTAGYLQAETRAIDQAIENSNKGLPKMINEETRLDRVSIEQKTKNYSLYITFINYSLADIDTNVLDENYKQAIKPASCVDKAFQVFFSEKYSINYVYRDKLGKIVRKYKLKATDC